MTEETTTETTVTETPEAAAVGNDVDAATSGVNTASDVTTEETKPAEEEKPADPNPAVLPVVDGSVQSSSVDLTELLQLSSDLLTAIENKRPAGYTTKDDEGRDKEIVRIRDGVEAYVQQLVDLLK